MKKIFVAHLLILSSVIAKAQNIGIGDPAPSAKLTVRGSESNPDGQLAAIKLQNTTATNSWFLRAGGLGTNTPGNGFSIGDNLGYHLVISQGGNTGIGINPATAKLHVNGSIKLEGTNLFEFGAGIAGKELNAGKIGYNGFGTNALAIVGAGSNTTNRAVYFFAEGGTTFSGPINVRGQVQIHGDPGNAGQVLTSNGSSAPTWTNTAFSNSTRFHAYFSTTASGAGNMDLYTGTGYGAYNLNPADVTFGANSITMNKTGLYRFTCVVQGSVHYLGSLPANEPELDCEIDLDGAMNDLIELTNFEHYVRSNATSNGNYYIHKLFTIDLHIIAGTNIRITKTFNWNAGAVTAGAAVRFFGYLIAE